ncbi:MAG: glycoside hydrolase family 13 protein [Verrucomicrobia bacterium]|nr:glycoside hydrolase family 13 protein [Verrucomicrobiota bacterium]
MPTEDVISKVPEWAKDAVWYQIFPERFRNGCPQSNPTAHDIGFDGKEDWAITKWGIDWYRRDERESRLGGFYHNVYHRRFGGDLVGVREKLGYLQDLGVTAIYLNPVFQAESLHKYDGNTFHHIDPTFGPDREGDIKALAEAKETDDPASWIWTSADRFFVDLVEEIHERGMRVIIDGVFNHTGRGFFAFEDLLKNGKDSRYTDWYRITKWKRNGKFDYMSWANHKALPELNRTDESLVAPVRDYIFNITRRWMDPDGNGNLKRGIDGWRLDVAFCVPHGFWKEWRRCVRGINPDSYLTGEIVGLAREYLQGDEFDAVMNYVWLYPSAAFFSPGSRMDVHEFQSRHDEVRNAYSEPVTQVLQNLLDSHDVGRIASMLQNGVGEDWNWDDYFHKSRVKSGADFRTSKPSEETYNALKQLTVFQMTYVGAPMIYYGTEVGMWGANDPDCRQPMLWNDIDYEPEAHRWRGKTGPTPRGPDHELLEFFKKAIGLRNRYEVLRRGSIEWVDTQESRLLAYNRLLGDDSVTVLINCGAATAAHEMSAPSTDLWSGEAHKENSRLEIEPGAWKILHS